jgi:hypothetical protein
MIESVKELDLQTMTAVGKAWVTDGSTALLLGFLGFSATKLWNTAVWHAKEVWKTTGKIPSYAKMDVATSVHKPGTWQTSLPHPRTGSVVALSELRA